MHLIYNDNIKFFKIVQLSKKKTCFILWNFKYMLHKTKENKRIKHFCLIILLIKIFIFWCRIVIKKEMTYILQEYYWNFSNPNNFSYASPYKLIQSTLANYVFMILLIVSACCFFFPTMSSYTKLDYTSVVI